MQRRDFIKILGLASGATLLESCGSKKGVEKLIPHVIPPEVEIIPGQSIFIPTTCTECPANCGVSARVTEKVFNQVRGRYPIKLEGISKHPLNDGKLCIRGQSSLTRLYRPDRLKNPLMADKSGQFVPCSHEEAFSRIIERMTVSSKKHLYLSSRSTGTLSTLIDLFCEKLDVQRLPEYEVFSNATIRKANGMLFHRSEVPLYRIEDADFLLTIGTDLFESFGNPVNNALQFARARGRDRFVWFHAEPHVSLTGLQSDERFVLNPESEIYLLSFLFKNVLLEKPDPDIAQFIPELSVDEIAGKTGLSREALARIAAHFNAAHRPLLIVGGVAIGSPWGLETAVLAGLIQWMTGMIQARIDFSRSFNDSTVGNFRDQLNLSWQLQNNQVGVLFISRAEPVGKNSSSYFLKENLNKAEFIVGLYDFMPTHKEEYDIILPLSHSLESWGDAESQKGVHSVIQPVMEPLHHTYSEGDILLKLIAAKSGIPIAPSYQEYLFAQWKLRYGLEQIEAFLDLGYTEQAISGPAVALNRKATVAFLKKFGLPKSLPKTALVTVPSLNSFDGRSRHLPLLREIPDPLTTVTHDGWISISEKVALDQQIHDGDIIAVFSGNKKVVELPAKIQPLLSENVAVLQRDLLDTYALLVDERTGESSCFIEDMSMSKTGTRAILPILAGSTSQQGRGVIPNPNHREKHLHESVSLYPGHEHPDYRWAMAIDLNLCIGCSACVAACYIENNVAIVGRKHHLKGREMSWIRIEPYYDDANVVHFLPMLCQHCHYAPCESVCPVYAPYHTPEGLNAQIYNRCIGTRYCSNNCPYKVRRFNWSTPSRPEPMDRMINPDMWTRPKGVMEKCTFCIQRIRTAKDKAKDENRKVRDGEVVPACAQTCPTNAIVFGNILDVESRIYQLAHSERVFRVFEQLGTEPSVYYLHRKRG